MAETVDDTPPSPKAVDILALRRELEEMYRSLEDDEVSELSPSSSEKLLNDCVLQLESRLEQVISEYSAADSFSGIDNFDAYFERLKEEVVTNEAGAIQMSNELDLLTRSFLEDSNQLKSQIEELKWSLDHFTSQVPTKAKFGAYNGDSLLSLQDKPADDNAFQILELDNEIEMKKKVLEQMEELGSMLEIIDGIEQIQDAFRNVKVIEIDNDIVRLSLRTHILDLSSPQKRDDILEPSELNHKLLIEVFKGTLELRNVEIFPSDVYIGDIVDAARSFRNSSIAWFVRKVQDRIILCTLRRNAVKRTNKSRHFLEYLDREETIVSHMTGGVDAFIKVPQGWPQVNVPLKLISLKSSDHHSTEISLSFICKVQESANNLDVHIRQQLPSFVDQIEKILVEQMRLEVSGGRPDN